MHYQLFNILRRFVTGNAGRWLTTLAIVLPLIFILSRYLGLSRNIALFVMFGALILILLMWLIGSLRKVGDKKRSENFATDLGRHSREEIRLAVDDLSQQWANAMRELKEHRVPIYELPWFLLIGEPQSGKTTTLEKSGLEFPIGQEAISGVGGTRNCDWWFTEEAVILDTAGRFTFQEDAAPDKHEWEAFLALLKKHRRECPINGVLVVIPTTSLTEDTLDQQREKALNIRRKLENLQKVLDIRFPIFVLVTKADRILGFSEFFGSLHPDLHGQIFGWSNPEEDKRWDAESFPDILREMTGRMHRLRLRLMQEARDAQQVDKFFVFPEELAALRTPLQTYLETIFKASSRFQEPFLFRGFYLTSGLQEGRPIAVACRDLLRVQVGDGRQVLEQLETVLTHKFAFFIRDFYSKKVFPEQGLVRQTIEAKDKQKKALRASKILLGVATVVAFLVLLPAMNHLSQVLKPVNTVALEAKGSLERTQAGNPWGVDYNYELIEKIEATRVNLRESRWLMRFLLQGGVKNEISQELLPTLQAGLFRLSVLGALLESFEARSGPEIWQQEGMDYELFRQALMTRLRFDKYQLPQTDRAALRQEIRLEPLLRYLKLRTGQDPSVEGKEIDEWLAKTTQPGDLAAIEQIFQSVLATEGRFDLMAVGELPVPTKALAAFEAYWSIEQLARRDFELIDSYLGVYEASYRGILALDPESQGADGGERTLAEYARLVGDLERAFDEGAVFMARGAGSTADAALQDGVADEDDAEDGEPTAPRRPRRPTGDDEGIVEVTEALFGGDRPGKGVEAWQKNCHEDYETLRSIYWRIVTETDIEQHCTVRIPEDWQELLTNRNSYDYLFEESPGGLLRWSEGAATLKAPLVALRDLVAMERVASERQEFSGRIANSPGDDGKLREVRDFYQQQRNVLWEPVHELKAFERQDPDERFRAGQGQNQAELVAALGTGRKILPPADTYLRSLFRLDCETCFSKSYAQNYVKPANEFLGWTYSALAPAGGVQDINQHLNSINNAVLAYLEAFIERQNSGGGGGLERPYKAAGADSWPRFADAVREWQLTVALGGGSASGLTLEMLEEFALKNGHIRPLIETFQQASRSQAPVSLPEGLEQAVSAYKDTVGALDDDPLKAWLQLAREESGVTLEDFHAFSRNTRLQRSSFGRWLDENVEQHGARLLSQEIRPVFERDAERLWDYLDRCCRDRFPFISERTLAERRRVYENGGVGGDQRDGWWFNERDKVGFISTITLELLTANHEDLDQLFFAGGKSDRLFGDYAVDVLLQVDRQGKPQTTIDFLGSKRQRFQALRDWQLFLYGDGDQRRAARRSLTNDQKFRLRLLPERRVPNRTYLGERVGLTTFLERGQIIRSSGPSRRLDLTLSLDEAPVRITSTNEDDETKWNGRLELRGGPLKLLYFVLVAEDDEPRADGRIRTIWIEIPDFVQPGQRMGSSAELEFERPVPGVVFEGGLTTVSGSEE